MLERQDAEAPRQEEKGSETPSLSLFKKFSTPRPCRVTTDATDGSGKGTQARAIVYRTLPKLFS
jgi:hypothetical protein